MEDSPELDDGEFYNTWLIDCLCTGKIASTSKEVVQDKADDEMLCRGP